MITLPEKPWIVRCVASARQAFAQRTEEEHPYGYTVFPAANVTHGTLSWIVGVR
jgi:hypothetical protein